MLDQLFGDCPSVGDFDADAHEAAYGDSVALAKLRAAQESDPAWDEHSMCKAIVEKLKKDAKVADRKAAREAWVAANPDEYAAEQAALAQAKAEREAAQ